MQHIRSVGMQVGMFALVAFGFLCVTLTSVFGAEELVNTAVEILSTCDDSQYTPWSAWASCTGPRVCPWPPTCEGPIQTCIISPEPQQGRLRSRTPLTADPACHHVSQVSCEELPACDCDLVAYSEWTPCTPERCGQKGSQTRVLVTRGECTIEPPPTYERTCFNNPCCDWAGWSPYTDCSATCGAGTRERTRFLNNSEDSSCASSIHAQSQLAVEECNAGACACDWLPYTPWTLCSRSCGVGVRYRRRARADPRTCPLVPSVEVEEEICTNTACDVVLDQQHFVGCETYIHGRSSNGEEPSPGEGGEGGGRWYGRFEDDLANCIDFQLKHLGKEFGPQAIGMSYVAQSVDVPSPCCEYNAHKKNSYYHRNLWREHLPQDCGSTCADIDCPRRDECVFAPVCERSNIQLTSCGMSDKRGDEGDEGGEGDEPTPVLTPRTRRLERGGIGPTTERVERFGDVSQRRLERRGLPGRYRPLTNYGLYPSTACHLYTDSNKGNKDRSPHSPHSPHSSHSPHFSRSHLGKPHRSAYRPIENTSKYLLPRCCDLFMKPVTAPNECEQKKLRTRTDVAGVCSLRPACLS